MSESTAVFSVCERYRYRLWREWDAALPGIAFLMLNPSTADEVDNDPTVERCERRARSMGFGRLEIINLFALRSTDPAGLYTCPDPVGPGNDAAIRAACRAAAEVVCAWGEHGSLAGRAARVRTILAQEGVAPLALGVNKSGEPKHPLYVAYAIAPTPYCLGGAIHQEGDGGTK